MKSSIAKRSIVIDGHKTSVSLEDAFWDELKEIAYTQQATLSALVAKIDGTRRYGNLSSAIRLYVLSTSARTGISNALSFGSPVCVEGAATLLRAVRDPLTARLERFDKPRDQLG
jgi:predicted DNA-binding ribbon-helix-helix protein